MERKYTISLRTLLALIVLFLINLRFFLASILDVSTTILSWGILLLTFTLFTKKDFSLLNLICFLFYLAAFFYTPYAKDVLIMIVSIIAFRHLPIRRFALINLLQCLFLLFIIYIIVENNLLVEEEMGKSFDSTFVSRDLGFGNPNALSAFVFYLLVDFYIIFHRKPCFFCMVFIPVSIGCFLYTGSRTFLIAETFLLLIYFLRSCRLVVNKWSLLGLLITILILIFYFSFNYDAVIDAILSHRLSIYGYVFQNMSLKNYLLGLDVSVLKDTPMDNAYITLIVYGGVFYLLLFVFLLVRSALIHFDRIKPYFPLICAILFAGIGESLFVAFSTANALLIWLLLLGENNNKKVISDVDSHNSCI